MDQEAITLSHHLAEEYDLVSIRINDGSAEEPWSIHVDNENVKSFEWVDYAGGRAVKVEFENGNLVFYHKEWLISTAYAPKQTG